MCSSNTLILRPKAYKPWVRDVCSRCRIDQILKDRPNSISKEENTWLGAEMKVLPHLDFIHWINVIPINTIFKIFFFINNIIYICIYNLKFWIGLIGAYLVFIFYVFPYYIFFSKATSHYTVFRNLEKLIYDDKLIYWLFLINMRHRCNKHDFILSKINSKLFF